MLDLSCRKKEDGKYYVVTDRWQKFSSLALRWAMGWAASCRPSLTVNQASLGGGSHRGQCKAVTPSAIKRFHFQKVSENGYR